MLTPLRDLVHIINKTKTKMLILCTSWPDSLGSAGGGHSGQRETGVKTTLHKTNTKMALKIWIIYSFEYFLATYALLDNYATMSLFLRWTTTLNICQLFNLSPPSCYFCLQFTINMQCQIYSFCARLPLLSLSAKKRQITSFISVKVHRYTKEG